MNNLFLITGIAGSGKTTLKDALADEGYRTYDVDDGFAQWVNRTTSQATAYDSSLAPMTTGHDWLIKEAALEEILETNGNAPLFLCGSAHNLYRYTDRFRQTFLLSYPDKSVVKQRLMSRTNNSYGKAPGELDDILGYWKPYEEKLIARGATVIDCTTSIDKIIEIIKSTTRA